MRFDMDDLMPCRCIVFRTIGGLIATFLKGLNFGAMKPEELYFRDYLVLIAVCSIPITLTP